MGKAWPKQWDDYLIEYYNEGLKEKEIVESLSKLFMRNFTHDMVGTRIRDLRRAGVNLPHRTKEWKLRNVYGVKKRSD